MQTHSGHAGALRTIYAQSTGASGVVRAGTYVRVHIWVSCVCACMHISMRESGSRMHIVRYLDRPLCLVNGALRTSYWTSSSSSRHPSPLRPVLHSHWWVYRHSSTWSPWVLEPASCLNRAAAAMRPPVIVSRRPYGPPAPALSDRAMRRHRHTRPRAATPGSTSPDWMHPEERIGTANGTV